MHSKEDCKQYISSHIPATNKQHRQKIAGAFVSFLFEKKNPLVAQAGKSAAQPQLRSEALIPPTPTPSQSQTLDQPQHLKPNQPSNVPISFHRSHSAPIPTGPFGDPLTSLGSNSSYSRPNARKWAKRELKCGSERRWRIWW